MSKKLLRILILLVVAAAAIYLISGYLKDNKPADQQGANDLTEVTDEPGLIEVTDEPGQTQPSTELPTEEPTDEPAPDDTACPVSEDGEYDSKDEVALYIHLFGHLPSNYITKDEARRLGWNGGSLEPYAPGCSIGGDYFGNYEGLLPKKKGRTYTECDIGTRGKNSRGAKRIIFSNDGLIYYTGDHYDSFTLLYGEE
ncbi:MAG: ribonuclease [Clostridia bacterium]|nr:ribonuclease [Clostridia bacterium]